MLFTVDNNQRLFLIQWEDREGFVVCNLDGIGRAIITYQHRKQKYKILHFWNGKFGRISKKYVNEMLEAAHYEPLSK